MKIYTLNAFAKTPSWWNPAWVVLDSHKFSDEKKQQIASKLWFSETAFVEKSDKADFKVRFFTPNCEVGLCGHATIATFSLMLNLGLIKTWNYNQETKAGILSIEAKENGNIFMQQNSPTFGEIIDRNEIARSLNIPVEVISDDLPIQIVSTGLKDIMIPVKRLADLHHINPDFEKIINISKKYDVVWYHVFSLESQFDSIAHCRNFAPLYEIPEEAATWTSNWALACYLWKYWVLGQHDVNNLVFEQGYSMNRPSEIIVKLGIQEGNIFKVQVWWTSSNIQEIEI